MRSIKNFTRMVRDKVMDVGHRFLIELDLGWIFLNEDADAEKQLTNGLGLINWDKAPDLIPVIIQDHSHYPI